MGEGTIGGASRFAVGWLLVLLMLDACGGFQPQTFWVWDKAGERWVSKELSIIIGISTVRERTHPSLPFVGSLPMDETLVEQTDLADFVYHTPAPTARFPGKV